MLCGCRLPLTGTPDVQVIVIMTTNLLTGHGSLGLWLLLFCCYVMDHFATKRLIFIKVVMHLVVLQNLNKDSKRYWSTRPSYSVDYNPSLIVDTKMSKSINISFLLLIFVVLTECLISNNEGFFVVTRP